MRTDILIALTVVLALSGATFAQTYFGPGTALDCGVAQIVIGTSGYYEWNQTVAPAMNDNQPAGSSCINVTVSDVTINCSLGSFAGSISRTGNSKHGIYVSSGVDNVTIVNCDVRGYTLDSRSGIYATEADDVTVRNCYLYDNRRGVDANNSDRLTVEDSFFDANINAGVRVEKGVGGTMRNNSVWGTINGSGMVLRDVNDTLVDWNSVYSNFGDGISVDRVDWANNSRVRVYNNTVYDNGDNSGDDYGIFVRYAVDMEIRDNDVHDYSTVQQSGIWLRDLDPSYVTGNRVYEHAGPGIRGADLDHVTFQDNAIYYNGGAGINVVTISNPDNPSLVFDGNDIEGNGDSGINADYVDDAVFTDNYLYDNSNHGINLYWSYDVRVYDDNVFEDNSGSGLRLDTWCDGARVYGNAFDDNGNYGVRALDAFDLQVYGNSFQDDDNGGVRIDDSDTVLIRDNTFDYEGYGVYADPSTNINITGNTINNSNNYGIYFDQADNTRVEGNYVGFSGFDGMYSQYGDTLDAIDNEFVNNGGDGLSLYYVNFATINDNTFAHNTNDGIGLETCDFANLDPNYVYDNGANGVHVWSSSDYLTMDRNHIYDNRFDGVAIEGSQYSTLTDNAIYGNCLFDDGTFAGVRLNNADYGYFDGNEVHDNLDYGYYLIASDSCDFYAEDVHGNGNVDEYAFYATTLTDLFVYGAEVYENAGAFWLNSVTSSAIISTTTHDNGDNDGGYYIVGCNGIDIESCLSYNDQYSFYASSSTDVDLVDFETYNNVDDGIYWEGSTGTMSNVESHDQPPGIYGLEVYASTLTADDVRIHSNADSMLYVTSTSTLDVTNLWMAKASGPYGVLWPAVTITGADTDATDSNLAAGPYYVALDNTDPLVSQLNVPATLTTYAGGCNGIAYYYLDTAFPASKEEILADGTEFTPAASSCTNNVVATYDVAGFSGYAASGVLSTGSAEDADKKRMIVETETSCPDDAVTFTVTHNGNPLGGVEVQLMQYSPYGGVVGTETTGSDGTVEFTLSKTAVYRAQVEKSGYEYMNPYVLDFSLCGEEDSGSCTLKGDSSCASDEACVAGLCTKLTGECGYASSHVWVDYGCCADSDCGDGMDCVEHACQSAVEEEQPPAEEVVTAPVPPSEEVAPPEEQPPAEETVSPGEGQQVGGQQAAGEGEAGAGQAGMEQQPQQGSNLLLLVLGLLVLAALGAGAYWLLTQQGKGRK